MAAAVVKRALSTANVADLAQVNSKAVLASLERFKLRAPTKSSQSMDEVRPFCSAGSLRNLFGLLILIFLVLPSRIGPNDDKGSRVCLLGRRQLSDNELRGELATEHIHFGFVPGLA